MRNNERGWIYVDALIGMVILSVAIAALAMTFTQSTVGTIAINNQTKATYLAHQYLSELKRHDHTGKTREDDDWIIKRIDADTNFGVETKVLSSQEIPDGIDSDIIPVKAIITWDEHSLPRAVEVVTYYYK